MSSFESSDILLLGAGISGAVHALRFLERDSNLKIVALDDRSQRRRDHLFIFFPENLSSADREWIAPYCLPIGEAYDIYFSKGEQHCEALLWAASEEMLHKSLEDRLGQGLQWQAKVRNVSGNLVFREDHSINTADLLLDARGVESHRMFRTLESHWPSKVTRAWRVQLSRPHELIHPVLIDARCDQSKGFHFFSLFPLGPLEIWMEQTLYLGPALSDVHLSNDEVDRLLRFYEISEKNRILVSSARVLLPVQMDFPVQNPFAIGSLAGFYHWGWGSSLGDSLRCSALLAQCRFWDPVEVTNTIQSHRIEKYLLNAKFAALNKEAFQQGRASQHHRFYEHHWGHSPVGFSNWFRHGLVSKGSPVDSLKKMISNRW